MELEWIEVPKGEFVMGTSVDEVESLIKEYGSNWFRHEAPQLKVFLDSFVISKYPVTNAQYRVFVEATGYKLPASPYFALYLSGGADYLANHPVAWVSWHDALAFCRWAGCRLPSRAEWEKAARGPNGLKYPWGNQWVEGMCNSSEGGVKMTTAVTQYPQGQSPYGIWDMAGNVWEWTDDWLTCDRVPRMWRESPGSRVAQADTAKLAEDEQLMFTRHLPVLRGGAVNTNRIGVRCAFRLVKYLPHEWGDWVGFRCVRL